MNITVTIERADFDSALGSQGQVLEGSIALDGTSFWHGWCGLECWGRAQWWPEAICLYDSAEKALLKFEAENLEHGCFYTRAVLTWDGAGRRWLLDASDAVRWCCGGNGYGTSIAV